MPKLSCGSPRLRQWVKDRLRPFFDNPPHRDGSGPGTPGGSGCRESKFPITTNGRGGDAFPTTKCKTPANMKSTAIHVPVLRNHYRIFVLAARLVRKGRGADTPNAVALIQFQLINRTPVGIAKDYLDCIGDCAARRRVRVALPRKPRQPSREMKAGSGLRALRSVHPEDVSRN